MEQPRGLSKKEIQRAQNVIDSMHPLSSVPRHVPLPFLVPFTKKVDQKQHQEHHTNLTAKQLFKQQLAGSLAHEDSKDSESLVVQSMKPEFDEGEDPIGYLGFGMVSYFDMIKVFAFVFLVLTCLNIPVMKIYAQGDNYKSDALDSSFKMMSMGNWGFSTTKCVSSGMEANQVLMSCETGQISRIVSFGINAKGEDAELCLQNTKGACYDVFNSTLQENLNSCIGSDSCKTNNLKKYVVKNQTTCNHEDSHFFVQYYCTHSDQEIQSRLHQGSYIGAISVFSCLFFLIIVYYLKNMTLIEHINWDMATTTAGDYTTLIHITPQFFSRFKEEKFDARSNQSTGYQFKLFFIKELENILTNQIPSQGFDEIERVKIADVVFAFHNDKLISLLRSRGVAIKSHNWKKMHSINDQINAMKVRNFQNLMRPVSAFITFESEEGFQRSLKIDENNIKWLDTVIKADEAPEPTNIIWENLHVTSFSRAIRLFFVVIVIIILIAISFSIIVTLKNQAVKNNNLYMQGNCKELQQIYGDKLMEEYTMDDWFDFYQPQEGSKKKHISPILSCFCAKKLKEFGHGDLPYTKFTDGKRSAFACYEWQFDTYKAKAYNQATSVAINLINFVLRFVLITLIKTISEDTISGQTRSIKNGIFIVQFFTTGILILLFNANLSEQGFPFFSGVLVGQYTDFCDKWYSDVGIVLVKAMIISAMFPVIEFVGFFFLRTFFKILDASFSRDQYKSKKKSINQYIDLFAGPEYAIHFRYSSIMNTVFVTFLYGTGLPILYPIALFAFVILYVQERMLICYYYRQPPMYDDKMTMNTLSICQWAPLAGLLISYWMLGNNQIFDNIVFPITYMGDVLQSGHTIVTDFKDLYYDQAFPPLVMAIVLLVLQPFASIIGSILSIIAPGAIGVSLNVDEDLPHYFEALEPDDREWLQKEEQHIRENYNIKILTDETLHALSNNKQGKKTIQGVNSYDILANPRYIADFVYVPADLPNRNELIWDDDDDDDNNYVQSDMVKLLLSLAYLPEAKAQEFSFKKENTVKLFK